MEVLAHTIANGMVDVGGEITTEVSSSGGYDYAVEVTSSRTGPGQAELIGRIREQGTSDPVLELRADIDLPAPDAPDE
jgi:thiamine biosynthesis lipoprotein ApbE